MKRHIGIHYLENPWHVLLVMCILVGGFFALRYSTYAYLETFRTVITIEENFNYYPEEPVAVNFSQPVFKDGYTQGIKVVNERTGQEQPIFIDWQGSNRATIRPDGYWKPESIYSIYFPEGKNMMLAKIKEQKFKFATTKYPRIKNFIPDNGAKDIIIDIEDPLIANFDKSTSGFFIKFSLDPQGEVAYENNIDKTQFKLVPKEKFKDGTKYTMSMYAKYAKDSDDSYVKIYESSFETLPLPPEVWEKDHTLRVEQAKKYTAAKKPTGKYINIDIKHQILSIFEDGKIIDAYMISSGKRGMDTPTGEYSILEKRVRPWSKKYALFMPWFMLFTRQGHGIHELPEWPGGYKEGANHLGIPVSHGCVRLGIGPAQRVYEWAEVGTPIIIH
jgi:lipoprotein-anchoring transpeptidase ErfK/SrfK